MSSRCYLCASGFGYFAKEACCPICNFLICAKCLVTPPASLKQPGGKVTKICKHCFDEIENPAAIEPADDPVTKNLLQIECDLKKKLSSRENKIIEDRLQKLKQTASEGTAATVLPHVLDDASIRRRLDILKPKSANVPSTDDLISRLAALKGEAIPSGNIQYHSGSTGAPGAAMSSLKRETRTEQQQINDLLAKTAEEVDIAREQGGTDDNEEEDEDEETKTARLMSMLMAEEALEAKAAKLLKKKETRINKKKSKKPAIKKNTCETDEELECRLQLEISQKKYSHDRLMIDLANMKFCCMCNADAEFICAECEDDMYCEECVRKCHSSILYRNHSCRKL